MKTIKSNFDSDINKRGGNVVQSDQTPDNNFASAVITSIDDLFPELRESTQTSGDGIGFVAVTVTPNEHDDDRNNDYDDNDDNNSVVNSSAATHDHETVNHRSKGEKRVGSGNPRSVSTNEKRLRN